MARRIIFTDAIVQVVSKDRPGSRSDANLLAASIMASPTDDASKANSLVDIITLLEDVDLIGTSSPTLVDTTQALSEMVGLLQNLPTEPPSLYIDLEGVNLSRFGTVSILQLHVLPTGRTYLIDIHSLRDKSFTTCADNGWTLKRIFESDTIPKVFFDVRNDSDALYAHFGIRLACIQDLQLMELATRTFAKRTVNGLSRCIERDADLSTSERISWMKTKDSGVRLFAPEKGGSYEVFNERPLRAEIMLYCAQDVQILPRLWTHYDRKLKGGWKKRMLAASEDRVKLSQSATFNGKGQHMALAPNGWH